MNKLLFIFILAACNAQAQTAQESIVVKKDPRVNMLVSKQAEINEVTTRNARRSGAGFRILVISSNNRNKVIDAKTKMYQQFPELKAYMMYQSPFFRLKVGNFKEREDAEEYLGSIQKLFKDGSVYVVPDTIEVKLDSDN
ncbi:MAG: SPOR domain-containing protein [Flavitalea sp.]